MTIREATLLDIPQIKIIRNSVKENILSDPTRVTENDYISYLTERGKGWVAEEGSQIRGFSIADLQDSNVWALFVLPKWEGKGIGKILHYTMLDWYFTQTEKTIWLSTGKDTRAEKFYRRHGWIDKGPYGKEEIKFEMPLEEWQKIKA
jgi:GNAT superfamily N-acetyltransferase